MTSFSPLPEPRRPTGPPDGGWFTGPQEDWHTTPRPAVPEQDQALAPRPDPVGEQLAAGAAAPADQPAAAAAEGPPAAAPARRPGRDGDEAWAMLGYLGVPFVSILAPLTVFLLRARGSDYVRQHATQALNLAITIALYNICAVIVAGILALDAVGVALEVTLPAALALWLVALAYLMRAAARASLGEFYQLPRWICATIAR